MYNIMTGLSCENIEIEKGMAMTGYLGRISAAEGIHDQLKIKCVVFDDGKTCAAYVVCDLLGLSSEFLKETADFTEEITSIPANNIIVACTHTHSGPASIFLRHCGEVDTKWMQRLKYSIARCVKNAKQNLEPSVLTYSTGSSDINMNRDTVVKEDAERLRDNQVGLLTIHRADDFKIKAMVVNYACHPTVLLDNNLMFSADFPYYLEKRLKEKISEDLMVVFVNGCCGNLGPIKCGSFEASEELGSRLASDVYGLLDNNVSGKNTDGVDFQNAAIHVETVCVEIPLNHKLDEGQLIKMQQEYTKYLADELSRNKEGIMAKVYKAFKEWAEDMLGMLKAGNLPDSVDAALKLLSIGNLKIVNIPFEAFHDIGLKIKKLFGVQNTMVVGYANGNFGYLPSKELYNHGYYETWDSFKYYGLPGPVCENAENIIYDALTPYANN